MVLALNVVGEVELHVVTQVIEGKLVVCSVGDVTVVGGLAFVVAHVGEDHTYTQSHPLIKHSHFFRVTFSEVVVHSDQVAATARETIEVHGQSGGEGFTFPGLHLRNFSLVEHDPTDDLYIVVAHPKHTFTGFTDTGKGVGEDLVGGLTFVQTLAEKGSLCLELIITHRLVLAFKCVDLLEDRLESAHVAVLLGAEEKFKCVV